MLSNCINFNNITIIDTTSKLSCFNDLYNVLNKRSIVVNHILLEKALNDLADLTNPRDFNNSKKQFELYKYVNYFENVLERSENINESGILDFIQKLYNIDPMERDSILFFLT